MVFTYLRNAAGEYVCPTCGETKKNQNTMHYHMKSHETKYSHECSVCKKGFLQKSTLDLHMAARHAAADTRVKQFKCTAKGCEFETLTKANLIIHFVRKHCKEEVGHLCVEGEAGLCCRACNQSYKSTTAFHYHAGKCLKFAETDERAGQLGQIL